MIKYLIFRTDRIGDFIFSRVLINAIKNKNPNARIDLVCSLYNSQYVKNFTDIENIYILDKYNFKLMIKNLFKINSINYDYLIILDSKRRSFFFSIPIKAKHKIALLKDWRPFFLLKLFFHDYLINSEVKSQYDNFITLSNLINLDIKKKINYYENYIGRSKLLIRDNNYLLLHLDEKWFDGYYFSDYERINLNHNNFELFIKTLFKKFKKKIIITSGRFSASYLDQIIKKKFEKVNSYQYRSIKYKNNLLFFDDLKFEDLELLVKKSCIVFCCEGAISHVSHALNKKTYALIQSDIIGNFWTAHMSKIKLIKRNHITLICKNIMKL